MKWRARSPESSELATRALVKPGELSSSAPRICKNSGYDVLAEIRRYWVRPGIVVALVVTLDQLVKAWVWRKLGPDQGTSQPLIGSWLSLTLVKNTGVAFGLFQNIPYFFTIVSVLISIGAVYFYRYYLPRHLPWVQVCVGLIVGGAIGNILDRLRYSFVIDFIHVSWFPGIFNLADSAITVGVIMLAGYLLLNGESTVHPTPKDDILLSELLNQDHWSQQGDQRRG